MTNLASRESYIESEYKKWSEKFEIPFQQEFNVKALLSMQHQFLSLPDDHVKAKADVIKTINDLHRNLNLKTRVKLNDDKKTKLLFLFQNKQEKELLENLFMSLYSEENTEAFNSWSNSARIKTNEYDIRIVNNNEDGIRGLRADCVFNTLSNSVLSPKSDLK